MKKTIGCILLCVLLIASANTIPVLGMVLERNEQGEIGINVKNYEFIDPDFFKTWEHDDYGAAFGYRSIVHNQDIYQIVRLGQKDGYVVVNDTVCVVKFDGSTGEMLKCNIFEEGEAAGPDSFVVHGNQIYVLGSYQDSKEKNDSFVLVYDLNLNLNNKYYILNSENHKFYPLDMISDGEYIYVTGTVKKKEENADKDIFLAKFDGNLNLVWNATWDFNGQNQDMTWTGSVIANSDNYVYVTGELRGNRDGFLLKISKSDGLSDFVIQENVYEGCSIDAAEERIYVAYTYPIDEGANIKLCAYDTDLNLKWSKTFDVAQDEMVEDILVTGNSIYITGTAVEFDPKDPMNPMLFNAYILKYDLEEGCKDWVKLVKEKCSYGFSINCDKNSLYLSGAITKIIGLRLYSFVLKCSKDGKIKTKGIPPLKKIQNKNQNFLSFLDKILNVFPGFGTLLQKIIDTVKKDFFTNCFV